MSEFNRWVAPLKRTISEKTPRGATVESEDFPTTIDVTGPLLYTLMQQNWHRVQIGHVVEGGVLELEFTEAPKICLIYDGYLTVATPAWHLHLCLEENLGGPHCNTPLELRQKRLVSRGAFYRRLNPEGVAKSWGIQFWNGAGENLMTIFLPNPFLGEDEDYLPEKKAELGKLALYEEL